jgi:hypothetical protein
VDPSSSGADYRVVMLDACLFVAMTMADPPAQEAAGPPAAAQTDLPDPQWDEPGLRVARPGYDLGVEGVEVEKPNGTRYKLSARQWNQIVREDPELWQLHVRGRLLVPGIIMSSLGGTWLVISSALAIDGLRSETATEGLFQWGFPAAIVLTGATMTIVGVAARRRLHEARRRMFVGPYADGRGGGVSLVGRF